MDSGPVLQSSLFRSGELNFAAKRRLLLRLIRASQPITRTEIADRLKIDKSTVTENVRPLIARGIIREEILEASEQGRRRRALSFSGENDYFIGVNLGVRHSQVGVTNLSGEMSDAQELEAPESVTSAL